MELNLINNSTLCCTCLSSDRNLISATSVTDIFEIFQFIMSDYLGNRFDSKTEQLQFICWECKAIMRRFTKFKKQVHNAQEQLHILCMNQSRLNISQSLSTLKCVTKTNYDGIFVNYLEDFEVKVFKNETRELKLPLQQTYLPKTKKYDVAQAVRDNIILGIEKKVVVPELYKASDHLIKIDPLATDSVFHTQRLLGSTIDPTSNPDTAVISTKRKLMKTEQSKETKRGYTTISLLGADVVATRELLKQNEEYKNSKHKCELCVVGFYTQKDLEDHHSYMHIEKPNHIPCKICYVYVLEDKLKEHTDSHYWRYECKQCNKVETTVDLITQHLKTHMLGNNVNNTKNTKKGRKEKKKSGRKKKEKVKESSKKTDLRKLGSKTTIVGYKCPECDMIFKNTTARMMHVARFHTEGFYCDHCKKKFANRNSLITHLKLHQGPLPKEECPICHKMVRRLQIRYHIRRHQNTTRYECKECNRVYQDLVSYQGHLKYSRLHGTEKVFKFPCPVCNKGYPTKQAMQDHFNYQHLGKTTHKCPVCNKPLASQRMVDYHIKRAHTEKKPKPRNHVCQQCGKAFYEKKGLIQHEAIHTGERPLSCDICQMTFRQNASLYTHRKRVHKIFPAKKHLEFMEKTENV